MNFKNWRSICVRLCLIIAGIAIISIGVSGQAVPPSPAGQTSPDQPAQSPPSGAQTGRPPAGQPGQTGQPPAGQTGQPGQPGQTKPGQVGQPTPGQATQGQAAPPSGSPLSRQDIVNLALNQASAFQQAGLTEQIAAEDVRQAQAAFLPKVISPSLFTYNNPATGVPTPMPGSPRQQSFIGLNAVTEYQGLLGVTGDLDLAGRLRATMRRNRALLEAAHFGTQVARLQLIQAVEDAYYAYALSTAKRQSAELSLSAAQQFEQVTSLLFSGGEVAQVDVTRARLQTTTRRDELEQARAGEVAAATALRALIGYDMAAPITITDLMTTLPMAGEIDQYTADAISRRPELAQLDAEFRAAQQEASLARANRRPQLTYNVNGGFDSDSLREPALRQHSGASASITLNFPIFDWGITKSQEKQAQLRGQIVTSERTAALRNFSQQFFAARTQAQTAANRVDIARLGVQDAEQNLQVSISRYRAGEAPILEVTDAQTTLATQRLALVQAIYDYQVAVGRLRQIAGP